MSNIQRYQTESIEQIVSIGKNFQKQLLSLYAENENFKRAASEEDNHLNNSLLLDVFSFFGLRIRRLTRDYRSYKKSQKTINELRIELQENLLKIQDAFYNEAKTALENLKQSTIICIEKSGFLAEIVTNPMYSDVQASQELSKL